MTFKKSILNLRIKIKFVLNLKEKIVLFLKSQENLLK